MTHNIFRTFQTTTIDLNNYENYKECKKINKKYVNSKFVNLIYEYYDIVYNNFDYYNTYTCEIGQCYNKKYNNDDIELETTVSNDIIYININILTEFYDENLLLNLDLKFEDFEKKIKKMIKNHCEYELSLDI
jgi:hypothetical protein